MTCISHDEEERGKELPLRLIIAVVAAVLITFVTGAVGFATTAQDWRPPLLSFMLALLILSWGGVFILMAIEVGYRDAFSLHVATRIVFKELLAEHEEACAERAVKAIRASQILSSIDQAEGEGEGEGKGRRFNSI